MWDNTPLQCLIGRGPERAVSATKLPFWSLWSGRNHMGTRETSVKDDGTGP